MDDKEERKYKDIIMGWVGLTNQMIYFRQDYDHDLTREVIDYIKEKMKQE